MELLAAPVQGTFEEIIQRGRKLQQLTRRIQDLVDPVLAVHCQVVNLRAGSLIVACDSTIWATRLRYEVPSLLEDLRQYSGLNDLVDIQIRVQPVKQRAVQQPRRQIHLSNDAAHCVQQCANSISDPSLRSALERLAKRSRK